MKVSLPTIPKPQKIFLNTFEVFSIKIQRFSVINVTEEINYIELVGHVRIQKKIAICRSRRALFQKKTGWHLDFGLFRLHN